MLPFRIPLRQWIEAFVRYLEQNFTGLFDTFNEVTLAFVRGFISFLEVLPPWALILVVVMITLRISGWRAGLVAALGLLLVENMDLWKPLIDTLALVLTSQVLVLLVGLPLGILAASSKLADGILRPILDFMQTMPAFVYLIPAVMFFGLGLVPGVVATFIFALPPLVRLTSLGIRQVPRELTEASDAFGATRLQTLFKVQLPVALPTVMAGVNQSIMLGLSMVVIAAMIGAGGLGADVLRGIQRLQIGLGFEAGLAVVILAIVLDRLTAGFTRKRNRHERPR
jgi:ABC-type proline/glycine betaine transport system permease subunit